MTMQFDFATAKRILFGNGTLTEIKTIAPTFGKKALLVSGKGGADPRKLLDILQNQGINWLDFQVEGEPGIELVQQALEASRQDGCDFVIGFGGGSVIDTSKATAVLMANPGNLLDYLEVVGKNQPLRNPGLPCIAIPTTAGTGSEVTRNAVLSVPGERIKVSLRSPYLLPYIAIIDPELTYSLPPNVTASTGMDALTQVLEPFVSKRANAITDPFCREGLRRAARSLLTAYQNGNDTQAREDMSYASLLGGLSLANAGLGTVHGFASVIGGLFEAPHGAICGCLLIPVTRMNIKALEERDPANPVLQRYQEIAQICTGDRDADVENGLDWLKQIQARLNIPTLGDYGINKQDFPSIVEKTMRASSTKANPIELQPGELTQILEEAL